MNNITDRYLSTSFAQFLFQDSLLIPHSLLENYQLLPMSDRELLLFLRLCGPLLRTGHIRLKEAAELLHVSTEEAAVSLQTLMDCGALGLDKSGSAYNCAPLFRFLHECWLDQQRSAPAEERAEQPAPMQRNRAKDHVLCMGRLYRRFEAELGRSLKYSENEQIRQWLEEDALPADMIEEALRRAILQNKGTLAYINSILRDWSKKGYRSLEQVLELDTKPEKQKSGKPAQKHEREDQDFMDQLAEIEAKAFKL